MPLRLAELPNTCDRQRLALLRLAETVQRLFFSISCAENRTIGSGLTTAGKSARFMYERRNQPLLSRAEFRKRVGRHGLVALGIVVFGLGLGIVGYHLFGQLGWIDSLLNASMILGGMGPVDSLKSNPAKIFASFYALFSGLAFISIMSVLVAPFVHRMLHRFHAETRD
jgi:hypothetical protein